MPLTAVVMSPHQAAPAPEPAGRGVKARRLRDWEVRVASDGSDAATANLARATARGGSHIRVLNFERNSDGTEVRILASRSLQSTPPAGLDAGDGALLDRLEGEAEQLSRRAVVGMPGPRAWFVVPERRPLRTFGESQAW